MTKHMLKTICCLLFLLITGSSYAQGTTDPILLDEYNEAVFDCSNDIFIEISTQPVIGKQFAARTAVDQYLYMTVKILYLAEQPMAGLDRTCFSLIHSPEDAEETVYPLNFAVTMISNRIKGYTNMAKPLKMPSYRTMDLVFNVDTTDKNNWTLIFTPMDRGGSEPYCSINVPLKVK